MHHVSDVGVAIVNGAVAGLLAWAGYVAALWRIRRGTFRLGTLTRA